MKQNEKTKIKLSLNNLKQLITIFFSAGIIFSSLSFILVNYFPNYDLFIMILLAVTGVSILTYAIFQKNLENTDKTNFYRFALFIAIFYLGVISAYAIYFFYKGELAANAFWFRAILSVNFIGGLILWNKIKSENLNKLSLNLFIGSVTITSIYFIVINLFGLKSNIVLSKDLVAILAASALAITIFQQSRVSEKSNKIISFLLFVVNSLTILLAQNLIALIALSITIFISSFAQAINRYKIEREGKSFFTLIINLVITGLLFLTYFVISTDFSQQLNRLKLPTIVVSIDTIAIFLFSAIFIGKYLMRDQRDSNQAILVLLFSSLFLVLNEYLWITTLLLLALNLGFNNQVLPSPDKPENPSKTQEIKEIKKSTKKEKKVVIKKSKK